MSKLVRFYSIFEKIIFQVLSKRKNHKFLIFFNFSFLLEHTKLPILKKQRDVELVHLSYFTLKSFLFKRIKQVSKQILLLAFFGQNFSENRKLLIVTC